MNPKDEAAIRQGVEDYCRAVHTGLAEDFFPIWAEGTDNNLISLSRRFVSTEAIYRDFIMGRIHTAYSSIDLIAHSLDIYQVGPDTAVVVFSYETRAVRREDGGIRGLETQVWVRQKNQWKLCHVQYAKDN